ncbi:MAG: FAD:protein FMN transferase [Floccifex porci]|uniref:FAD:protein FMN transferase n=1 Tax=Floccifex porci TaxID=2606629 RepID=UPI003F00ED76
MKKTIRSWFMIVFCFLIFIISLLFYLSNPKSKTEKQSITLTNLGFDTAITFTATCTKKEFDQYVSLLSKKYTYYNQLFDPYHEYELSNIYTINHQGYHHPVEVDEELIDCIQIAKEVYDIQSKFDITSGKLLSLWHTYRIEGIEKNEMGLDGLLPSEYEIQQDINCRGFDKIRIEGNTIELLDENIQLDLGGIAKGYASQKVKEALNKAGCDNGFINAGGNVVLLSSKEQGWKIGIQNPDESSSLLEIDTKEDVSIVTSGDYQRYYTVNGTEYSHIIDPDTGYPATYNRSVTVITKDSSYADALSTLLFLLPIDQGLQIVNNLSFDVEVIWIYENGSQTPDYQYKKLKIYCTDPENVSLIQTQ